MDLATVDLLEKITFKKSKVKANKFLLINKNNDMRNILFGLLLLIIQQPALPREN